MIGTHCVEAALLHCCDCHAFGVNYRSHKGKLHQLSVTTMDMSPLPPFLHPADPTGTLLEA